MPGEHERQLLLKALYEELGTNFRHFLAWRRALFVGYFGILAGLGAAFEWTKTDASNLNAIILAIAAFVSVIFWLLDIRNRRLIDGASVAGAELEEKLGIKSIGYYSEYQKKRERGEERLRHSTILGFFYATAILFFLSWFWATL